MADTAHQQCIHPDCGRTFAVDEVYFSCPDCGALLDVVYDWNRVTRPSFADFERRWRRSVIDRESALDFSGVWRFRELLPFAAPEHVVTAGEGQTVLQRADALAGALGMKPGCLQLQYEGFNPSGSFKDNGMTAAITMARMLGRTRVACASTGNTSASMALFASLAGETGSTIRSFVFVGSGKIAFGKLAQALDYGAVTLQVDGDFDACMARVREAADRIDLYLMNSVNPFRLEGQKAIMYRVLECRAWEPPDWIIVPGGNLGNSSAFGKAYAELHALGLVKRVPRLAIINASGANTLFDLYEKRGLRWNGGRIDNGVVDQMYGELSAAGRKAKTVASAIEIGRPVNLSKALRSLDIMNGLVREVTDEVILEHKALIGRCGFGCEPASAASLAGLRQLREAQIIGPDDRVVCILTGHQLKDPNVIVDYHTGAGGESRPHANPPRPVPDSLEDIIAAIESA